MVMGTVPVSLVTKLSLFNYSITRQLELIIEYITCNGSESSLSDCLLEVSQNPQATNWSLVYMSCGKHIIHHA